MSSQIYLSPRTQNAKGQWRPAIMESGAWAAESNPAIHTADSAIVGGVPVISWGMYAIWANDHEALAAVENVYGWPDYPLSASISSMAEGDRDSLRAALLAHGVDAGAIDNAELFRDVIYFIAVNTMGHSSAFDPDQFVTF